MPDDRRLSEEEARRLWRRAAELQAEAAHRLEAAADEAGGGASADEIDRTAGYALEDVRAAAREAGIDDTFLGRALAELDAAAGLVPSGDPGGLAERFLAAPGDALVVSHLYHAPAATVYEALRRVMPRPPYELEVVESRGHPLEGGTLSLEVPADWTARRPGDFSYEVRGWADIKEVHLTLRPSRGGGESCEVTLICPLNRSKRINLWTGGGLTVAGTVAGGGAGAMGLATLAQAAAGGLGLFLTVLTVAWVVAAPLGLGYAGMLGYRALYAHGLGRARKALLRLLDAVAVEAGLEGALGGAAFPPLPTALRPPDEGAGAV